MNSPSPVILTTERLYAREFTADDTPNVFAYAGNIENTGFMTFSPESYENADLFIKDRLLSQIEQPRRVYDLAVCLKDTDEFIGTASLTLDNDLRQAELGYVLLIPYWKQGYATEIARALLRFGFLGLDLHRIFARCDCENTASYKVMERIGMRREAHFIKSEYRSVRGRKSWRSTFVYAILMKEYLMRLPDGCYSATEESGGGASENND